MNWFKFSLKEHQTEQELVDLFESLWGKIPRPRSTMLLRDRNVDFGIYYLSPSCKDLLPEIFEKYEISDAGNTTRNFADCLKCDPDFYPPKLLDGF